MFKHSITKYTLVSFLLFLFLVSCGSQKKSRGKLYNPKEVASLSQKLGITLSNTDKEDDNNMYLYAESSLWLGVPYRHGGLSRKGVDCSGFTFLVYQKVYGKNIPRSTADLSRMKMHSVSKRKLKAGDFVFFATNSKSSKISHVGIYLKDGYFVHASTSRGVIISHLNEDYYKRTWKKAGRMK